MLLAGVLDFVTDEFFAEFTDSSVYFAMAAVGTSLFVVRMILLLAGGHDGGDLDVAHTDLADTHDSGFTFFSLLSILSFLMGAGWFGLACRREWGVGPIGSAFTAASAGFFLMTFTSFGLYQMRKLEASGGYDVNHCVGSIGRVYLKIPPKGEGRGQIEITVDGRRKVLPAVSEGDELPSFVPAEVVGVQEDETLVVRAVRD